MVTAESFAGTLPAIQRTSDHRYIYQGITYPGVTKALGVVDKSGPLMYWAAKQAAGAAIDIYEAGGLDALLKTAHREGAIKALADQHNWARDEAAQLGTEIHGWADQHIRGVDTAPLSETAMLYTHHYAEWWQRSGWKLRLSEAVVCAPASPGAHEGWGGTFDLLCYDRDGRTVLADIKTGKGVYREASLQLAAYGMAPLVSPMGSQDVYPMPNIDRYAIIHVTREGVREIELNIGAREWAAWLACLDLYRWTETVKGRL